MLNERQLEKVRNLLPKNGYQLIADVIGDTTPNAVRMALMTPERFKDRKDIADAIVVVMKKYREAQRDQAKKVLNAVK